MRSLIIISILFISSTVYGQNTGLYGKKWCIDLSTTGTMPLINMTRGPMYKSRGGELVEKMDLFDYGIRTGVSYAVTNNFSVGVEFDMEFMNFHAPENGNVSYPSGITANMYFEHEALKTNTLVFMPRLSFTSENGLLPIGLSHQLGVGFSRTKVLQKDYDYVLHPVTYNGELPITSSFADDFYDYTNESFKGLVFMYTLNVRTPINKFMMITYGIRYNFNFGLSPPSSSLFDSHYLDENTAYYASRRRRSRSIISLNLGVAFAL